MRILCPQDLFRISGNPYYGYRKTRWVSRMIPIPCERCCLLQYRMISSNKFGILSSRNLIVRSTSSSRTFGIARLPYILRIPRMTTSHLVRLGVCYPGLISPTINTTTPIPPNRGAGIFRSSPNLGNNPLVRSCFTSSRNGVLKACSRKRHKPSSTTTLQSCRDA